jgi:hypothetical protein
VDGTGSGSCQMPGFGIGSVHFRVVMSELVNDADPNAE